MSLITRIKDIFFTSRARQEQVPFATLFGKFQSILEKNNQAMERIADMGDKMGGDYVFDRQYVITITQQIRELVYKLIHDLNVLAPRKYFDLFASFERISMQIQQELEGKWAIPESGYIISYEVLNQDFSDEAGNKNAKLAEIRNVLELPTPDGFAVSTKAFQVFLEHNGLQEAIVNMLQSWEDGGCQDTDQVSQTIQNRILQAKLPPELKQHMTRALEHLRSKTPGRDLTLAVRSSAWAEDAEHSFAGQFRSVLNVSPGDVPSAYREVLAGAYSPSALDYRSLHGGRIHEIAMAVGCQVMVDAKASGVVYTIDPAVPEKAVLLVSAVWGLGAPMVEGEIQADQFTLERTPPHAVKSLKMVPKTRMLVPRPQGGTQWREVEDQRQYRPCLNPDQLRQLAEMALLIERYFKRPQDIEWVLDSDDRLVILQARPLNIKPQTRDMVSDIAQTMQHYPVLLQGKGAVVQSGIATGKVFVLHSDEDLNQFPQGAILVAKQTSPRLARVMRKAHGIITDIGSPTGHMATIAREFRVPTVVNTGIATQTLQPGMEITLDATQNVVYAGIVTELCYYEFTEEEVFEESYEYRLLSRMLKRISPLNLLDPHDPNFTPAGCNTMHDIIRFIHEKAVEEVIQLGQSRRRDVDHKARRLVFDIPLGLVVLDIGGGIEAPGNQREVTPDQIASVPMRAFLSGLMERGMWNTDPMAVDFGSFMSSLTRTFSSQLASPEQVGQNLAVISHQYFDLNLRLGYHFNIIDAYIADNPNDNYAYFRFLGGVTDPVRRSRRAKFIAEILERFNFRVEVHGDLVVGRIKKLEREQMEDKMWLLGCLVGYTRQLDVRMHSEQHLEEYVEDFVQKTARQREGTEAPKEVP
ncbi:MAG TPA: pyruvate, water dikinase [Syntrophobacteraceae bacterium]|nr:pyruvate, water dikinase [Syntrophobacteraceae bacterium]